MISPCLFSIVPEILASRVKCCGWVNLKKKKKNDVGMERKKKIVTIGK